MTGGPDAGIDVMPDRPDTGTPTADAGVPAFDPGVGILPVGVNFHHRGANVFTYHNDNARTGANLHERQLTPQRVGPTRFGKLFSQPVDGVIYAQPLYASNVNLPGRGPRNLVFVATQHDSVYAFDADSASGDSGTPLWQRSFLDPTRGVTTVPSADVQSGDIQPEIGITGTPVIDPHGGTLYVVAKTKEGGGYPQRLHALDIRTGHEKFGGPVMVSASVPGGGNDAIGGQVPFLSLYQIQRSALLLQDDVVYVAWGCHGDNRPCHGWMIGYDAHNLAPVATVNTTPDGSLGGVWLAGGGPAADGTGVYFVSGNGDFIPGTGNLGDSLLRFSPSTRKIVDSFTPFNQAALNIQDLDLGSGGVLLLPDQAGGPGHLHLLVSAGKEGTVYLVDRDAMGGFQPGSDRVVQTLQKGIGGSFDTPAYFNGAIYYQGVGDVLKAFSVHGGALSTAPVSQGTQRMAFPGATPSITANGSEGGIVWLLDNTGYIPAAPVVLHAYDAADLTRELYNSAQMGPRDATGLAVKFSVPTVANGKVYVGSRTELTVFGLL